LLLWHRIDSILEPQKLTEANEELKLNCFEFRKSRLRDADTGHLGVFGNSGRDFFPDPHLLLKTTHPHCYQLKHPRTLPLPSTLAASTGLPGGPLRGTFPSLSGSHRSLKALSPL